MKKIIYFISLILLISSCSVSNDVISYEKTNASLINKSIQNLNVVNKLEPFINKSDKIAIVGMEDYKTSDYSLLVTLEDEIIKEFVSKGYTVLERDHDMIYRMFSEEEKKYKHINRVKSSSLSNSGTGAARSMYGMGDGIAVGSGSVFLSKSTAGSSENYEQEYQSNLNSADKLLSYRVIESGVVFNLDSKDAGLDEVEREARTILEARLIDAKTSKILTAITFDGESKDFVDSYSVKALENFSYKYYSHTLPKQYGNPVKKTVLAPKTKKSGLFLGVTLISVILIVIAIGG